MAGAVLLALFASQSTVFAATHCDMQSGDTAPSAMAGASHGQHDLGNTEAPGAPTQDRRSGCDHSLPTNGCGMTVGCLVAVPGTSITVTPPLEARHVDFPAPGSAPRALEFAPDTPPPRS